MRVTLDNGEGLAYRPGGARQRWKLRIEDPGVRAYGIQVSPRMASEPARLSAGQMFIVSPLTMVVCEDDSLPTATGCSASAPIQFFHHTEPATDGLFEIDWLPPASGGDVEVYVAANASVAGQRNSRIHLSKFTLRSGDPPARLVNAASLEARFSSNTWVRISGSDLAPSAKEWSDSDIRDGVLPTELNGTSVRINGRLAAISSVSPERIAALAPSDPTEGIVPIEIVREGSVTHEFTARKDRISPALFAPKDPGCPRCPIALYGTGFGATHPQVDPSLAFAGAAPLTLPFRVTIGGREARAEFGGLVSPGLFQFNVEIPDIDPGEHPVTVEIDGVRSAPVSLTITRVNAPSRDR